MNLINAFADRFVENTRKTNFFDQVTKTLKQPCLELFGRFSFFVLRSSTRAGNTLCPNIKVINYASNTPCNRIIKTINVLNIDMLISTNFHTFKTYKFTVNISYLFTLSRVFHSSSYYCCRKIGLISYLCDWVWPVLKLKKVNEYYHN